MDFRFQYTLDCAQHIIGTFGAVGPVNILKPANIKCNQRKVFLMIAARIQQLAKLRFIICARHCVIHGQMRQTGLRQQSLVLEASASQENSQEAGECKYNNTYGYNQIAMGKKPF